MLPEAMSDILELSVRAADSNSQAFIRLTGGSSAEVSLDIATESSGAVEWVEVWNEKVQANSTLFDGLHVRLAAPTAISGFRLRTTPNALFEGSDKLTFSMGRQVSLVRVASGSDMDATASKTMSMSAQSVLVNAAKTMDVSVSESTQITTPRIMTSSGEIHTQAETMAVHITDGVEVSGEMLDGSFGEVDVEIQGLAKMSVADAVVLNSNDAALSTSQTRT